MRPAEASKIRVLHDELMATLAIRKHWRHVDCNRDRLSSLLLHFHVEPLGGSRVVIVDDERIMPWRDFSKVEMAIDVSFRRSCQQHLIPLPNGAAVLVERE